MLSGWLPIESSFGLNSASIDSVAAAAVLIQVLNMGKETEQLTINIMQNERNTLL